MLPPIKWPKPRKHNRPERFVYWTVLKESHRDLEFCEICGERGRHMHCHHLDGNPWNNELPNLQVLCPRCHEYVKLRAEGIYDDLEGVVKE